MARKFRRNYAWMPIVWEYLKTRPRDTLWSYEEIINGATLKGVERYGTPLKNSSICPNKLQFSKVMGGQEGIVKVKENYYTPYRWGMNDKYRTSRFERGRVII